jgi:ankyrin repeat protein
MTMEPFDYAKEKAPVVTAVLLERMSDLKQLVVDGADINAQDELGRSALIAAIDQDFANPEWAEFLIASGIDINLQDKDGDTALDIAKYRENKEAVELLCKHKAIGKDGPSAKEQQWDEIYTAFDATNAAKKKDF